MRPAPAMRPDRGCCTGSPSVIHESEDNKTTLGRYVAALQSGDEQAIRSFFAEGASWTLQAGQMPISGTWTGRDEIIDGFFATAMAHYEPGSVRIEVTAMIAEQDQVVIQAVREYMDTLYACDAFWRTGSSTSVVAGGV